MSSLLALFATGLIPVLGILALWIRQERLRLARERKNLAAMLMVAARGRRQMGPFWRGKR